jgi:hypothetical protein
VFLAVEDASTPHGSVTCRLVTVDDLKLLGRGARWGWKLGKWLELLATL